MENNYLTQQEIDQLVENEASNWGSLHREDVRDAARELIEKLMAKYEPEIRSLNKRVEFLESKLESFNFDIQTWNNP